MQAILRKHCQILLSGKTPKHNFSRISPFINYCNKQKSPEQFLKRLSVTYFQEMTNISQEMILQR